MEQVEFIGPGGGVINWNFNGMDNEIRIPREETTLFFRNYAIKHGDLMANKLGLYSMASVGRNGEITWGKLGTADYLIQPRGQGCVWNPTKGLTSDFDSTLLQPWKIQFEQCPDALWNSILEKVLGTGIDVTDFFATTEGQLLFMKIIEQINLSAGNSYYMMVNFGQNDLITTSNTNNLWVNRVTAELWDRFRANQSVVMGFYTYMDKYKDEGLYNFDVEIADSLLSNDKLKFTGDAIGWVDTLIEHQPADMSDLAETMIANGIYPTMKLSKSIFERFQAQNRLTNVAESNPNALRAYFTGVDAEFMISPNTLMYKGYFIVKDTLQEKFDNVTGTVTHRGFISLAGNFGIAHDTAFLNQYDGLGMRIYQDNRPQYGGKIFADSYGKVATAILDKSMIVHGSATFTA